MNQLYNKITAEEKSKQAKENGSVSDQLKISKKRDAFMDDFMHKCAKRIITFSVANGIDTIVVGENKGWKNKSPFSKKENQNFVQIPFNRFKAILKYMCRINGIIYTACEESYTSKASFMDNDFMPVYDNTDKEYTFSGKRGPGGYRGLYRCKDGTIINSDLNGSANIGRKAFPKLFKTGCVDFNNVRVYKHPDMAI